MTYKKVLRVLNEAPFISYVMTANSLFLVKLLVKQLISRLGLVQCLLLKYAATFLK